MYEFMGTLSESRLVPSTVSLRQFRADELADLTVLYLCGLYILYQTGSTKSFAINYAKQTLRYGSDFKKWQSGATDLYAMLYALEARDVILDDEDDSNDFKDSLPLGLSALTYWLKDLSRGSVTPVHHRSLFTRLDFNFKIYNSSIRAVRRMAMDWENLNGHERQLTMTRLLQLLRNRAPKSEILAKLQTIARTHNWELTDVCDKDTGIGCGAEDHISILKIDEPKKKTSVLLSLAALTAGAIAASALEKARREKK